MTAPTPGSRPGGRKPSGPAPKTYDPLRPWGSKKFTKENVADDLLREQLTWLQEICNAISEAQFAEEMPPDELATRARVSESAVLALLRGDTWPSYVLVSALLSALGVQLSVDAQMGIRPFIEEPADRRPWRRRRR